jgi:HAD superfamily hydrolase (TIGR01459 family)
LAHRILHGLREIVDDYDVFVVDQWGVMHDGSAAFAGAREVLLRLRSLGARVVLVSNSSRPLRPSVALLRELGFEDALYDAMITAGELGRRWLSEARAQGRVQKALSVVEPWDADCSMAEAGVEPTLDPHEADVLIASGVTPAAEDAFDAVLSVGVARGIPLLCLNPDLVSVQPDGQLAFCGGTFAERYRRMGGEVRTWGKPEVAIYAAALAAAPGWRRGLAIGDSLHHDVAGGRAAGLDTLFVTRGVHWPEVASAPTERANTGRLAALLAKHDVWPDQVMTTLTW